MSSHLALFVSLVSFVCLVVLLYISGYRRGRKANIEQVQFRLDDEAFGLRESFYNLRSQINDLERDRDAYKQAIPEWDNLRLLCNKLGGRFDVTKSITTLTKAEWNQLRAMAGMKPSDNP